MDSDISIFQALYRSFYNAPGGFKEELHEIRHKIGSEIRLNYDDIFYTALRLGRSMEHATKGSRTYTTMGYGVGYIWVFSRL